MDLAALKNELTTDPLLRNYAAMTDEQAADSLNLRNRQPDAETLSSGAFVASLVSAEYDLLSNGKKDYCRLIAMAGSLPITAQLKTELAGIFAAGTQTRANLLAAVKRTGSRAEELGLGRVTPSDVANARRL
jgi:hypothetical protein